MWVSCGVGAPGREGEHPPAPGVLQGKVPGFFLSLLLCRHCPPQCHLTRAAVPCRGKACEDAVLRKAQGPED